MCLCCGALVHDYFTVMLYTFFVVAFCRLLRFFARLFYFIYYISHIFFSAFVFSLSVSCACEQNGNWRSALVPIYYISNVRFQVPTIPTF